MHRCIPVCKACCPKYYTLPDNLECFKPQVCQDVEALFDRHSKAFTLSKRMQHLAHGNAEHSKKYVPECPCMFRNPVEIIRLDQSEPSTRITQLSFPPVRKLLDLREHAKRIFPPFRYFAINRLIRLSLFSLYSRLSNARPPLPPVKKYKWTEADWEKKEKYYKKLSKPKHGKPKRKKQEKDKPAEKETKKYGAIGFDDTAERSKKRLEKLALPKDRSEPQKQKWVLTPGMKYYQASERLKKLAQPKEFDMEALIQPLPTPITPAALKYKASDRIKELATPKDKGGAGDAAGDLKENPFAVAPNALKAKCSERVEELAEPKEYSNVHIRENPNLISPAALKAKASKRTIELAQPRQR